MAFPQRIFLDANVLVAIGLKPEGDYSKILGTETLKLVTSEHILSEVAENLALLGKEPDSFIRSLRELMEVTDRVVKLPAGLPLYDDEDRQALSEAIASGCHEFVTFNSRDFGSLYGQTVMDVFVRHSAEFMRIHFRG